MKLAVLMAAWNAEAYVSAALASVISQGLPTGNLQVVVVDDGSTDNTARVVGELAAKNPFIQLIRTPNRGVTRARNAALAALPPGVDFVTFLDADDLVPPNRYVADLAAFSRKPSLDMVYGNTTLFRVANSEQTAPAPNSATATGRGVVLAAGTYRSHLVHKVGPFDTQFSQAEDLDFLLRMFELAPQYEIQERDCLFYRRHGSNLTRDTSELRRNFARALLYSIKRRKANKLPPIPQGVFDTGTLNEGSDW